MEYMLYGFVVQSTIFQIEKKSWYSGEKKHTWYGDEMDEGAEVSHIFIYKYFH